MRKLVSALAAAALVLALGAPAFADSARSPSNHQVTAMRAHGDRHEGWHHGDRDDRGYYRHGYYRHHYGYYDRDYYDGYYYDGYSGRCRWAYYHDPYYFDRYCNGYY